MHGFQIAAGQKCYAATHEQMGTDPNFKTEANLLRLHATALMDFVCSLTLIVFYFYFGKQTQANIEDQDGDMITMADYTVQVVPDTLPIDTDPQELREWVEERFGAFPYNP